jgi:hypothetical protein
MKSAACYLARLGSLWLSSVALCAWCERASGCEIASDRAHIDAVRVQTGDADFEVNLAGSSVKVASAPAAGQVSVISRAPLRFRGTAALDAVPFRSRRPRALLGGRVTVGPGAAVRWHEMRPGQLRLSLDTSLGVVVESPLWMPCTNVTVADTTELPAFPTALAVVAERSIGLGEAAVPIFVKPATGNPVRISYPGAFELMARSRGWVHVRARWADGSEINGWTEERFVTDQVAPPVLEFPATSSGPHCVSGHGPSPFKLRRGAAIYTGAGGQVWARLAETEWVMAYPVASADGWAQLGSLPGVSQEAGASCEVSPHMWANARDFIWVTSAEARERERMKQ